MKTALVSMLGNVGTTLNSQGGGYGLIVTRMVRNSISPDAIVNPPPSEWSEYDRLLVCESINYRTGSYNIPGGPQKIHREKMIEIQKFNGKILCVNSHFDFNEFNRRIGVPGRFPVVQTIDVSKSPRHLSCVIGDSHALSVWSPGHDLDFTPGRTLYRFLENSSQKAKELNERYKSTITYFGNIDLRFHLMRRPDPSHAAIELIKRYVDFSEKLVDNTIIGLLPVEHESRKIPGTGLYKGEKFFGTRLDRMRLRHSMHRELERSGVRWLDWPDEWIDDDGTKMLDVLETRQSVHIKPKHYMFGSTFIEVLS